MNLLHKVEALTKDYKWFDFLLWKKMSSIQPDPERCRSVVVVWVTPTAIKFLG